MDEANSVVFIPKYRRRTVYEQLRKHLGEVFHESAWHRERAVSKKGA